MIAENLDEIVYISDMDSYELYYLNPAGRILTGIHDYKGRKCYKVLQGRNAPCEFCTIGQAESMEREKGPSGGCCRCDRERGCESEDSGKAGF